MNFDNNFSLSDYLDVVDHDEQSYFGASNYDEPIVSRRSIHDQLKHLVVARELVCNTHDITERMWVQLVRIMYLDPSIDNDELNRLVVTSTRVFFSSEDALSMSMFGEFMLKQIIDAYEETVSNLINSIIENAEESFKVGLAGAYPMFDQSAQSTQQMGV